MERLPNGRVTVDGLLPVGVLEYPEYPVDDGAGGRRPRRELLSPEEFGTDEAIASFMGAPLLLEHPEGLVGRGRANAAGALTRYVVLNGARRIGATIYDGAVIDDLRVTHQLSDAYTLDEDHTPGVWNGQPYDLVQRNPRGDHVAIVRQGRGGAAASLRVNSPTKEQPMKTVAVRANKREHQVQEAFARALAQHKRFNFKPRRRNQEEGEAEEGGAAGMTTVSVGGSDYEVPTDLAFALVTGLPVSFSVGDQTVSGTFYSEAMDEEEAVEPAEEAPADGMPYVMNSPGSRRKSKPAETPKARANAGGLDDRVRALEDALREERSARQNAEAEGERARLEPVLRRVLGTRFNAAHAVDDSIRQALAARWPSMATMFAGDSSAQLRARFDILREEVEGGDFSAIPPDRRNTSSESDDAERMKRYNARQRSHLITAQKAR